MIRVCIIHERSLPADGWYVTCNACAVYYLCRSGIVRGYRQCPGGLVWDDLNQQCQETTSNCPRPFS
ncbi:hypothetical protein ACOMHN_061281 [Nucella lapillus]